MSHISHSRLRRLSCHCAIGDASYTVCIELPPGARAAMPALSPPAANCRAATSQVLPLTTTRRRRRRPCHHHQQQLFYFKKYVPTGPKQQPYRAQLRERTLSWSSPEAPRWPATNCLAPGPLSVDGLTGDRVHPRPDAVAHGLNGAAGQLQWHGRAEPVQVAVGTEALPPCQWHEASKCRE